MNQESTNNQLSRKQFLVGAATAIGATAVSLSPAHAVAKSLVGTAVGVGFVKNGLVVPASSMFTGDASLTDAKVTIQRFGSEGNLKSVDAFGVVPGVGKVAFSAWTETKTTQARSRFVVPAETMSGIQFQVVRNINGKNESSIIKLGVMPGVTSNKLAAGTYVIVDSNVNWGTVKYDASNVGNPVTFAGNVNKQYLLITIESNNAVVTDVTP